MKRKKRKNKNRSGHYTRPRQGETMTTEQQMVNVSSKNSEPKYLNPDEWLWCLKCETFFQARELKEDDRKIRCQCPSKKCNGSGFQMDIYKWDAWAGAGGSRLKNWPVSVDEITSGQKCSISR